MADHMQEHQHAHPPLEYPLEPFEAFQLLSYFISTPNQNTAHELRHYLPEIRNMAFYYRFQLDFGSVAEPQAGMVRQFIAQTYAAQMLLERYAPI